MGILSGLGGLFTGASKTAEDAVNDVVGNIGKYIHLNNNGFGDIIDGIGHLGQDTIDLGSKFLSGLDDSVHSAINGIPKTLSAVDDLAHYAVNAPLSTINTIVENPGDLNKLKKNISGNLAQFDDIGTDVFGSGSWLTGGANYLSTGNPFYGAGTMTAQVVNGDKYTPGSTTSAGGLMGLYDAASNVGSGNSSNPNTDTSGGVTTNYGNVDVGSGTYSPTYSTPSFGESPSLLGASSGSSGLYGTSSTLANTNQGNNMFYNTNYGSLDPTSTGVSADGIGSGFDTNQGFINPNQTYTTGSAPTTFDKFNDLYQQFASGINSPLGRLGLTIAGQSNPRLAALARIAGAGGEGGGYGQALKGLGDIYSTEMQRRTQRDITRQQQQASQQSNDFINNQINSVNEMYGPNSAYADQMRKQLDRQDAAAGRRSQYGTREVELQAKLASQQAAMRTAALQQAPQFAKNIQTATNATNARSLGLLDMYLKNQQNINGGIKQGAQYLSNLF